MNDMSDEKKVSPNESIDAGEPTDADQLVEPDPHVENLGSLIAEKARASGMTMEQLFESLHDAARKAMTAKLLSGEIDRLGADAGIDASKKMIESMRKALGVAASGPGPTSGEVDRIGADAEIDASQKIIEMTWKARGVAASGPEPLASAASKSGPKKSDE